MSRYISWTDVVGRYPDAAKFLATEAVGSHFIVQAEAEVDGRLSARYLTPFVVAGTVTSYAPPTLVQDICIDLTYYKLTWRQKDSKSLYDYIKDRINAMANGTLVLPASLQAAASPVVAWGTNDYRSSFGPDNEIDWSPDPDSITDAELSRQ